jgi:hypothetical protein
MASFGGSDALGLLQDGNCNCGGSLDGGSSLMDKGAHAAEAATGVYLLGLRGPNAGITPTAGVYSQDDTYFHSGKIGGGTTLPTGGLSDFFQNSF